MARALLVAVLLFAGRSPAQEGRGFAEVRLALFPGVTGDVWQVVERVRPTFSTELTDRVKLVATVEAGTSQGRDPATELARTFAGSALGPLLSAVGCEPRTWQNPALRLDDVKDVLDVDRLYVDAYTTHVDVRLGRQALNWGSARFVNPTDPFPQVLFTEPWRPRRGVNALRVLVPLGESADLTAVAALDDTLSRPSAAGRARARWKGVDVAATVGWRGAGHGGLVGLDLRGTAVVGYWLEAAWVFSTMPHEELAVGVDYSFPVLEQLVLFAQYNRNGAGVSSADGLASLSGRLGGASGLTCTGVAPFGAAQKPDPFAPFLVGRDYLLVGASLGVLPELSVSATGLQNLGDGTALAIASVGYAVRDWLDVSASASVPVIVFGHGGELKPRPGDLTVSVDVPGGEPLTADLTGLVPAATLTLWTRASF